METIELTVYKLQELEGSAKERAKNYLIEGDEALAPEAIRDCFEMVDEKPWWFSHGHVYWSTCPDYVAPDKPDIDIGEALKVFGKFPILTAFYEWDGIDYYLDSYRDGQLMESSFSIDLPSVNMLHLSAKGQTEVTEFQDMVATELSNYTDLLMKIVNGHYEYIYSDEYIYDSCEANGYRFFANGTMV